MAEPAPAKARMTWFWVLACFILCVLPVLMAGPLFAWALTITKSGSDQRETDLCKARLVRLHQALVQYAADNGDALPPAERWVEATWPLVSEKDPKDEFESFFRCPTISKQRKIWEFGYALNKSVAGKKFSEIAPDEFLIFDSDNLDRNAVDELRSKPSTPRHFGSKESYGITAKGVIKPL
jgi:hypothetical protein